MNIIEVETANKSEKYQGPKTNDTHPFYIISYGKTLKDVPCYQIRMNSPIFCIQYVISGSGKIIYNDKLYNLEAGDIFLLHEGSNHIYYSNPDNHFERIWFNFEGELSRSLINIYKLNDTVVFPKVNSLKLMQKIYKACRSTSDPLEYKRITTPLFLELIQFIAANKQQTHSIAYTKEVERIRLYIERRITENIKIQDIAEKFSFSPEHIIRIFKKIHGITPHQYILQSKIRLAMVMLKTSTSTIDEIAENLNFTNSQHFSTQFKKITGYNPTQYRNNKLFH